MKCFYCNERTEVKDTRTVQGGAIIRRHRVCKAGHTETTYEVPRPVAASFGLDPFEHAVLRRHIKDIKKNLKSDEQ